MTSRKLSPIAEPLPGLFYLDLARVNDDELKSALPRLVRAHDLIFDLRARREVSNALPAHLIERTARGPRLQLPVRLRPGGAPLDWLETFWTLSPAEPHLGAPCAFLLGESSKGYAETLLAKIEHERRCELVGSRSAGMNGTINLMDLPGGFLLTLTGLKILKPRRRAPIRRGHRADASGGPCAGRDCGGKAEVLEAALALLQL